MQRRIGEPVVGALHHLYGADYSASDVANTAVTVLDRTATRDSIRTAEDPWAYFFVVLKREMIGQVGAFFRAAMNPSDTEAVEDTLTEPDYVTLAEAVQLTISELRPLTPASCWDGLTATVNYLAERGHSRLSYVHSNASQDIELRKTGLTKQQILAVANAVLGSRPHHGKTSLLGGYLQHDGWNPRNSKAHLAALEKYASRMAGSTVTADRRLLKMAS